MYIHIFDPIYYYTKDPQCQKIENEKKKIILGDFKIQTYPLMLTRLTDLVIGNRENKMCLKVYNSIPPRRLHSEII